MDELDRQLLAANHHWQQVLQAYLELTTDSKERPADENGPRWADRIVSMNELDPAELSSIHGQLIAQGWLKFQFELGQSGLTYRVSKEGRNLLKRVQCQTTSVPTPETSSAADTETNDEAQEVATEETQAEDLAA